MLRPSSTHSFSLKVRFPLSLGFTYNTLCDCTKFISISICSWLNLECFRLIFNQKCCRTMCIEVSKASKCTIHCRWECQRQPSTSTVNVDVDVNVTCHSSTFLTLYKRLGNFRSRVHSVEWLSADKNNK